MSSLISFTLFCTNRFHSLFQFVVQKRATGESVWQSMLLNYISGSRTLFTVERGLVQIGVPDVEWRSFSLVHLLFLSKQTGCEHR